MRAGRIGQPGPVSTRPAERPRGRGGRRPAWRRVAPGDDPAAGEAVDADPGDAHPPAARLDPHQEVAVRPLHPKADDHPVAGLDRVLDRDPEVGKREAVQLDELDEAAGPDARRRRHVLDLMVDRVGGDQGRGEAEPPLVDDLRDLAPADLEVAGGGHRRFLSASPPSRQAGATGRVLAQTLRAAARGANAPAVGMAYTVRWDRPAPKRRTNREIAALPPAPSLRQNRPL